MKRLGVYAFIATLLVSLVGGFSIPRVNAQTIPPGGTYPYFQGVIDNLNSTAMSAYDSALVGHQNDANFPVLQKEYQDVKAATQKNYDAYISTLNSEKAKGTAPAKAQILATSAWTVTATTFNHNKWSSSAIKSAYAQYANLVQGANLAAVQIDREVIAAGTPAAAVQTDASTITNAAKGNTNEVKQTQADPDACSLFDGDLIGCVDQLVAWLIKHTLLQVAGFLVWLTANMLNFAIQISILDFSKWAPSSLYPIWIIIRQIVSLVVVFAGLYLGFMYIIGREDAFGKYVGWLVIFALFVNFSYPVTRALTDVSNIVSLNVYSAAVGTGAIETNFSSAASTLGANTAGALIMNRLGLQGLVGSALEVNKQQTGVFDKINSTPGALLTLAFVLYAAYVFFMATAIIATRTAILVFLIVASPLLLVDSVIPKLGEAAMKMRKLFFEQLIVAPIFMIMLALTLKFMEIFQDTGGPLGKSSGTLSTTDSVSTFFGVLLMLIMLHIMLKVTKSVAGEAGTYATNMMGKVGGFGLGVASAGTGLLARGTVGQLAMGARDSKWMDGMKDSKIGRGLYGLSNSLAQSTFDTRNIGMVSRGMASAGLTGGLGVSMQQGGKRGFEAEQKAREEKVLSFGSNIRDDKTRASYFGKANNGFVYSKVDDAKLRIAEREAREKKDAQVSTLMSTADKDKRQQLIDQALASKDFAMADKLKAGDAYLKVNNSSPTAAQEKAELLKKMGLTDKKAEDLVNKQDPFADLQKEHDIKLKELDLDLGKMKRSTDEEKKAYDVARTKIGEFKSAHEEQITNLRKETLAAYSSLLTTEEIPPTTAAASSQSPTIIPTQSFDPAHPGGSDFSYLDNAGRVSGSGGSDMSQAANNVPAVQRVSSQANSTSNTPGFLLSGPALKEYRARKKAEKEAAKVIRQAQSGGASPESSTATPAKPVSPSPATTAVPV